MGVIGIRVEIERFASLGDTFLVLSSKIIGDAEINVDSYGEGIEFERAFKFRNRTVEISDAFKDRITEPMMRRGVVGIERDRFFEFAQRQRKIEIEDVCNEPERSVWLGEIRIERDRFVGRFLRLRICVSRIGAAEKR